MAWLSAVSTVLSLTAYPITYLAYFGYGVLRLLVNLLIGLARYPLRLVLLPFRVLAQFEAILIFITAAACIGLVLGVMLYCTTHLTVELFNQWLGFIVSSSPLKPDIESINKRYARPGTSALVSGGRLEWGGKKSLEPWGASGPSTSTILEEDDEYSSAYLED
ncbi:uncharacterized protein LDX57_008967 [Aspergillus melleus]|uniref:uncharacterized protein n=1 Tax=Aspergillus melleus TaxID=138277 RepID=UPI001E8CDD0D|nr:uncharacterized protein LDX57_008967 [Aspergillus melleus]KAH8431305.1 hypothetical protein LDX57_008967 [Aspergillus melleus]